MKWPSLCTLNYQIMKVDENNKLLLVGCGI